MNAANDSIAIEVGRLIFYPGDMANASGYGLINSFDGVHFNAVLFDGRMFRQVHRHAFEGLRPWRLLDKVHGHPADHEWECNDGGYIERCAICGETRDYDGSQDDGRDFTPPYEP